MRRSIAKRKRSELIDALAELAEEDRKILRQLEIRFDVQPPQKDLIAATRQAIADATDFDERRINYNFDYDYRSYEIVGRNLKRLADANHWKEAMELALELMDRGSQQIEMSDEGLMTEDVEQCLKPLIKSLRKSKLPAEEIVHWCHEMNQADRVGFVCDEELEALREKFAR